jgi:endoglucanase
MENNGLLYLLSFCSGLVFTVIGLQLQEALAAEIIPPLKTKGPHIVDSTQRPIRLSCVNWYGAEEKDYVVGGLYKQSISYISRLIRAYGFNCVRLPFSLEIVLHNPSIPPYAVTAEKSLLGAKALDGLDAVVNSLSDQKVAVILDNHMSKADWCCSSSDGNGLWYTDQYSEQDWTTTLKILVERYKQVKYVVGIDLRNELRSTVVHDQHLSPTWGDGSNATDWHAAAERCANALLSINADLLMIVEGLQYSADLTGVATHPIQLTVPDRVVYEAHDYSWFFGQLSYEQYKSKINEKWGYLVTTHPLWLGEFGTCNTHPSCYTEGWWLNVHRYLNETGIGWSFWALDGTQSTGSGRKFGAREEFGILNTTWSGPSTVGLLKSLQSLMN